MIHFMEKDEVQILLRLCFDVNETVVGSEQTVAMKVLGGGKTWDTV